MKILGSDFDGTLAEGGITEEKCAAVARWRAAGHKFGIISGRGGDFLSHCREAYPALPLDFYAACNGAYITDGEGRVIAEAVCREVSAAELLAALYDKSEVIYIKVAERCMRVVKEGESRAIPSDERTVPYEVAATLPYFHCFSACLRHPEEVGAVGAEMGVRYRDHLTPLPNGAWVDLVPRGINKAEGLRRVAAHFGADEGDVIAVGDNTNDVDMISAFRSYAMENGVAAVKAVADGIVRDVTEVIEREI